MKRLALVLAAAALAGCAAKTIANADLEEAQRIVPTCAAGPDCDAKWSAARRWIDQNISFKLIMSGDYLLQTEGPIYVEWGTSQGVKLAASVRRVADGPERFRIVAEINCGNPFGCYPEWQSALLDFNRTVGAAQAK
jgi:hypothetical protein